MRCMLGRHTLGGTPGEGERSSICLRWAGVREGRTGSLKSLLVSVCVGGGRWVGVCGRERQTLASTVKTPPGPPRWHSGQRSRLELYPSPPTPRGGALCRCGKNRRAPPRPPAPLSPPLTSPPPRGCSVVLEGVTRHVGRHG